MKNLKKFNEYKNKNISESMYNNGERLFDNEKAQFMINIWNTPSTLTRVSQSKYVMKNMFGMKNIKKIEENNSDNKIHGKFENNFEVCVEENSLTIKIYPEMKRLHEDNIENALYDAIGTIADYYNKNGWSFLKKI